MASVLVGVILWGFGLFWYFRVTHALQPGQASHTCWMPCRLVHAVACVCTQAVVSGVRCAACAATFQGPPVRVCDPDCCPMHRFNMGFWGFTFPLGARQGSGAGCLASAHMVRSAWLPHAGVFTSATIALGKQLPSAFFQGLAVCFELCLVILWLSVSALTVCLGRSLLGAPLKVLCTMRPTCHATLQVMKAWTRESFVAPCLSPMKQLAVATAADPPVLVLPVVIAALTANSSPVPSCSVAVDMAAVSASSTH